MNLQTESISTLRLSNWRIPGMSQMTGHGDPLTAGFGSDL